MTTHNLQCRRWNFSWFLYLINQCDARKTIFNGIDCGSSNSWFSKKLRTMSPSISIEYHMTASFGFCRIVAAHTLIQIYRYMRKIFWMSGFACICTYNLYMYWMLVLCMYVCACDGLVQFHSHTFEHIDILKSMTMVSNALRIPLHNYEPQTHKNIEKER